MSDYTPQIVADIAQKYKKALDAKKDLLDAESSDIVKRNNAVDKMRYALNEYKEVTTTEVREILKHKGLNTDALEELCKQILKDK